MTQELTYNDGYMAGVEAGKKIVQADVSRDVEKTIRQAFEAEAMAGSLDKKQLEDIARIVNSEEFASFRTYLVRQSLEFYAKAGNPMNTDAALLARFGNLLKEILLDMERMKDPAKESAHINDPYDA